MAGKFLQTAYKVLEKSGRPMTAKQIVASALQDKLLISFGKTPEHTMRARISEEMRSSGSDSHFIRIGPNRFGLREWGMSEYYSRPFNKALPDEVTVCVPGTVQDLFGTSILGIGPYTAKFAEYIADRNNITYVHRSAAETTSKYKQLVAYVLLETTHGDIVSYIRGKYSSADKYLLLGKRSIGFGGHVLKHDAEDLFGSADGGLLSAARREISEELSGSRIIELSPNGVIWDDSSFEGQRHIGIFLRGVIQLKAGLTKGELSIRQLELLDKESLWTKYHQMEFWSQLIVQHIAEEVKPSNISSIAPNKRPSTIKAIAFVGEIACGKSSIAQRLAAKLDCKVISASHCLSNLIQFFPKGDIERLEFQKQALEFISNEGAPKVLAEEIHKHVSTDSRTVNVIDGIRHLVTLSELRTLVPSIVVIYVDCPRDKAFRNFEHRWPDADLLTFAAVREHEVERDIPNFRYEADAILHNADTLDNTVSVLTEWLE